MSDLETLRAEADRLRDELVAHDQERDQLAQTKRDTDAVLFAAERADQFARAEAAASSGEPQQHATIVGAVINPREG